MKKLSFLAFVFTMAFAFAIPTMATPAYDSTVYVNTTPDDKTKIVLSGG
ncbi:MAG: hypothetical protein LBQ00_01670 [Syntrophobacterales bacterium]|jgi:hypothetical protein|nr:hypothetical protein [Syntrophobacterales bacterium]